MALTDWEREDLGVREACRDTFGVVVTYTPASGSPVSTLPDGRPLKGEFCPIYQDVSASEPAVPSAGPRLEFVAADLNALGITDYATMEGKRVTLPVRGQMRTYWLSAAADADIGSVAFWLGDREAA